MATCRASQGSCVARISFGQHVEHVIVQSVVVVGRAVILVGDENDEEVGVGPQKSLFASLMLFWE